MVEPQTIDSCALELTRIVIGALQAKRMLDECRSRNSALESSNYALNVHLKQATAQHFAGGGPPDVC
jgi:hypothetical protein